MTDTPIAVSTTGRLALRIDEIAHLLGISQRTIDRLRARGEFPPPTQRAGRCLLWAHRGYFRMGERRRGQPRKS